MFFLFKNTNAEIEEVNDHLKSGTPPFLLDGLSAFDEAALDEFFEEDSLSSDILSGNDEFERSESFFGSNHARRDDEFVEYTPQTWLVSPTEAWLSQHSEQHHYVNDSHNDDDKSIQSSVLSAHGIPKEEEITATVSLASSLSPTSAKRSYSDTLTNGSFSDTEKDSENEQPKKKKQNRKNGALSEARWRAEWTQSNDPTMPEKRPVGISLASGSSTGWRLRLSGTQLGHYATAQQAW
eukprot:CAMPEP_0197290846 /NCGR_PEP_ID=MMETSP0890-20130614/10256_1 /TAXON_ID=44058 ORGANISM="Aureoumbra lagunensis, Strain CCMP1510" /NCGR_SAMPLE_ID=MMETSP0890 /ASSEMBLY_ACC=CAM_ASM_000533 /LENGTH=237 /DNA_ID=CAMNT_0042763181 /DNA_START=107 /DNA_END=817 /DNA_ORIENTATION=+